MSALIIVALVAAIPFVFALVFRVSATLLFVSIMVGSLLVEQFGDDASLVVSSFVRSGDPVMIPKLALQIVPVVLMLVLARRTVGKTAALVQFVPLLFACVLLAILSVGLLPANISDAFYSSAIGTQIRQSESLIIGAAAVSQLLFIWATQRPEHHKTHRGKHH